MPKPLRVMKDRLPLAFAKMIRLLSMGSLNCHEVAKQSGLTTITVYRYCSALHSEHMAHIAGWEKDPRGYHTVRVFKLGPGEDAPSPNTTKRAAQRVAAVARKKALAKQPAFPTV